MIYDYLLAAYEQFEKPEFMDKIYILNDLITTAYYFNFDEKIKKQKDQREKIKKIWQDKYKPGLYKVNFRIKNNKKEWDEICNKHQEEINSLADKDKEYTREELIELLINKNFNDEEINLILKYGRKGHKKRYSEEIEFYSEKGKFKYLLNNLEKGLSDTDRNNLPPFSFYITFKFKLKTNFFTQSDSPFFLIDNHLARDKALGVPIVKSSTWKGNLRWVALKHLVDNFNGINDLEKAIRQREQIIRLFGNENKQVIEFLDNKFDEIKKCNGHTQRESNEIPRAGRLRFFPAFFRRIGLDIINPHSRTKRKGEVPITYEVVPKGTEGTFNLLYLSWWWDDKIYDEIGEDLELLGEILRDMMIVYGFSGKRGMDYGTVEDNFTQGAIYYYIPGIDVNKASLNFSNFDGLSEKIKELKRNINGRHS